MPPFTNDKFVATGTRVRVCSARRNWSGTIISANNWSDDKGNDWYIEIQDDRRGYCFLKQRVDDLGDLTIEQEGG